MCTWFTKLPARMTAWLPSALAVASSRRTMQASARTYPSAEASSVLHRPSAVSMPATAAAAVVCSASMRLTPPASAEPPYLPRFWAAMWIPTIAEEHAVSMLTCNWNFNLGFFPAWLDVQCKIELATCRAVHVVPIKGVHKFVQCKRMFTIWVMKRHGFVGNM